MHEPACLTKRCILASDDTLYTHPPGCRFLGKAYFLSGDTTQAENSYREAVNLAGDPLPAWKGLAEIFVNSCSVQPEATETFEKLVQLLNV